MFFSISLREARTEMFCVLVTRLAVALKLNVRFPAGTTTLLGTERTDGLLLTISTFEPPVGASPSSETVNFTVWLLKRLDGEAVKPDRLTGVT